MYMCVSKTMMMISFINVLGDLVFRKKTVHFSVYSSFITPSFGITVVVFRGPSG